VGRHWEDYGSGGSVAEFFVAYLFGVLVQEIVKTHQHKVGEYR